MVKKYKNHIMGRPITSNTDSIAVDGHVGKWYVIDETTHKGRKIFLLEHELYGDDTAHIAVNANGNVVCDGIYDDFPACLNY